MRLTWSPSRAVLALAVVLLDIAPAAWGAYPADTIPGRWIEPLLPESLPKLDYPKWANPVDRARLEVFRGRYKRALMSVRTLPADADKVDVAIIKGEALAALGRRDEALAVLAAPAVAGHPRVRLLTAIVLSEAGRHDEAIALLRTQVEKDPDSIAARYHLAATLERTGDLRGALRAYTWFVEGDRAPFVVWQREQERAFENAEDVVYIGRAADRWAAMTSAYKGESPLHDAIFNTFVRAYDVIDREYWPAHVAAAEYQLGHDNAKQAADELNSAGALNPNDARARALAGRIAVEQFNFDGADAQIEALRRVDAGSVAADLLEARNLLQQRQPIAAAAPLHRVLEKQPRNVEAMGLLASAYALQLKEDKAKELLTKVDEIDVDHDDATAYFEVAEQLGAMRQYDRAAAMYKVAIERAPWWTEPRNGLGLLYTQSGDEDEAQATLDAAHTLDPFNLRTTNYLRLLEDLNKMARKESAHFIVMYDAATDPVIPEYFNEYLESIHDEVAGAYRTSPAKKTMIEVFPSHDAFSVRTTGSPWIGTVGASTGRVIALVAPRKGETTMGTFNWAQVLRHEYTHTVTLAATDNRIAHWMTEGLAVYQEKSPLRWDWVPMLYKAVSTDSLFTLDNLTWGFVRPKRPSDRQLAYAQSYWICKYLEEKYGHDAVLSMLELFKTGMQQEEVFPKVTGRSTSEFTEDFFAWARGQVATWGYDEETTRKYNLLRQRGEEFIKAKKYADAAKTWEELAVIRPVDALPHQRLAGLYLTKEVNDKEKAIAHLEVLHAVELKDNRYAKRIAAIYRDMGKLDDAERTAMQAVYVDPYDLAAHKLLAGIAEKTGNTAVLDRERRVITTLEAARDASSGEESSTDEGGRDR